LTPPGNTSSGAVLEDLVVPVLKRNGYAAQMQLNIGGGLGGGKHYLDALVTAPNAAKILVSLKWQQTGGTTDEKVPFEVIKLLHAMHSEPAFATARAYIIIGGDGFRARLLAFYKSADFRSHINHSERVEILTLNEFITRANKKNL
jgi:hypothetical protein